MSTDRYQKVTHDHLRRDAFLYVRQSSLRQVFENTESTKRQYALRERAVSLGWPIERIHVIDADLGLSGASAEHRTGSSNWFRRSPSVTPASYSDLRCLVWRATTLIGTGSSNLRH